MVEGDFRSVVDILMTIDFDHYNISRALDTIEPPAVRESKAAVKKAREAAKAEALAKSPEQEKVAAREMAAAADEEAEESERAAAADEESEEEDDMVCISRCPPLTHNLTHSTPLPPSVGVRPRRRVRGCLRGRCERRRQRQAQEEGVQEGKWCLRRDEGAR